MLRGRVCNELRVVARPCSHAGQLLSSFYDPFSLVAERFESERDIERRLVILYKLGKFRNFWNNMDIYSSIIIARRKRGVRSSLRACKNRDTHCNSQRSVAREAWREVLFLEDRETSWQGSKERTSFGRAFPLGYIIIIVIVRRLAFDKRDNRTIIRPTLESVPSAGRIAWRRSNRTPARSTACSCHFDRRLIKNSLRIDR